jgi:hypothetical protein
VTPNRPTNEFKPLTASALKNSPLTVGLLLAVMTLVAAVITFTRQTEEDTKTTVKQTIKEHCDKRIDSAHPDIKDQYVPRTEVERSLHKIDTRLIKMDEVQNKILERLPRRRTRRIP